MNGVSYARFDGKEKQGPSSGGPAFASTGEASLGEGYGPAESAMPAGFMFHDALAEEAGQSYVRSEPESASEFARRLLLPARGINWGILHAHNAVDVAGRCGSGVYAASPGQVSLVHEGWDGGYGNYVEIDHGNGVYTRYAHNEKNGVSVGQMVAAGDRIASMGSTGNSTGCHVHFEIAGAGSVRNPFAKK